MGLGGGGGLDSESLGFRGFSTFRKMSFWKLGLRRPSRIGILKPKPQTLKPIFKAESLDVERLCLSLGFWVLGLG